MTKKVTVLLLIAAVAGIVVSFSLLQEDVASTAHTLIEYFPAKFGVTPASSMSAGMRLGCFVTIAQIVAAGVAFAPQFSKPIRLLAGSVLLLSVPFDAWTDVVYRSGYLSGNLPVAAATTIAFYTFGSEIMQSLSWVLVLSVWRQALADSMWSMAHTWNSLGTIKAEWGNYLSAARNQAAREMQARALSRNRSMPMSTPTSQAYQQKPTYVSPSQDQKVYTPRQHPEPTYHPVNYEQ